MENKQFSCKYDQSNCKLHVIIMCYLCHTNWIYLLITLIVIIIIIIVLDLS
jgi:hypothetical protein